MVDQQEVVKHVLELLRKKNDDLALVREASDDQQTVLHFTPLRSITSEQLRELEAKFRCRASVGRDALGLGSYLSLHLPHHLYRPIYTVAYRLQCLLLLCVVALCTIGVAATSSFSPVLIRDSSTCLAQWLQLPYLTTNNTVNCDQPHHWWNGFIAFCASANPFRNTTATVQQP
jgi:hypothetical protein